MTSRIAIVVVVAACLFGAGFALAKPGERSNGAAVDAAPQALAVQRVDVDAGLSAGTPAQLRPAPVRRKPAVKAPVTRTAVQPTGPRVVATPRPVVTTTPARPVATAAPQPTAAPQSNSQPEPQTPSYVGSGFDDSG